MDYKHRRRKAPPASSSSKVSASWTPTYYGDGLELSLERTRRGASTEDDGVGYGAFVSPSSASGATDAGKEAHAGGAAGDSEKDATRGRRPRSAPRGHEKDETDEGQYRAGGLGSQERERRRGMLRSRSRSQPRSHSRPRSTSAGKPRSLTPGRKVGKKLGGLLRRKKKGTTGVEVTPPLDNICDYCSKTVYGKSRDDMYQRLDYAYCSTACTKRHQQALDAEAEAEAQRAKGEAQEVAIGRAHVAAGRAFAEGGWGSPPIAPSAALLPPPQGEEKEVDCRGENGKEEREGRQFFPSTAATANSGVREEKGNNTVFENDWFHPEDIGSNGEGNENNLSKNTSQDSSHVPQSSFGSSTDRSSPTHRHESTPSAPFSIRIDRGGGGRGVRDEYREYNDELSRQLRLAARQDELDDEARRDRRRQFIVEHCRSPARMGGTVRRGSGGVGEASPRRYGGGSHVRSEKHTGEASPGRPPRGNAISAGGSHGKGKGNMNGNGGATRGKKKYPVMRHHETSTQSTESISSSSQGCSHGGTSRGASPVPPPMAPPWNNHSSPQRSEQSHPSSQASSSWGYLDVGGGKDALNDSWALPSKERTEGAEEDRAFGAWGDWPPAEGGGRGSAIDDGWPAVAGDGKTPRTKNSSASFPGKEVHGNANEAKEAKERAAEHNNGEKSTGADDEGFSKDYRRQVSSLSNASPLPSVAEEGGFGARENDGLRLLAQKRGLRSTGRGRDVPPLTPPPRSGRKSSKRTVVIERVDDVASVVSHYDDPSLTSLATNDDTLTTRSSWQGRRQPRQRQRSADPPGESIDEILRQGIHPGEGRGHGQHWSNGNGDGRREQFIRQGRDPSFQEDPSYHGMEPDDQVASHDEQRRNNSRQQDTPGFSPQRRMLDTINRHSQNQHRQQELRQQNQRSQSYPKQQQPRQGASDQSLQIQGPPQLRRNHEPNSHDEEGHFDVDNIQFPSQEKSNRGQAGDENFDDSSMGMLTGEDDDEPPMEPPRGDDDTATGTLDTIDLVEEVKRVWRHVQRYEKKKTLKKQAKQRLEQGNAQVDVSNLTSVDEDGMLEDGGDTMGSLMEPLVQHFGAMQVQHQVGHRHHGQDGDSKFSDITPSSSHYQRGRGRDRTPDGRLGKHIRSTSAHSRQHTPRSDSPGMESELSAHAMASRTSTERDVQFLGEGVDAFYDEAERGSDIGGAPSRPQRVPERLTKQTLHTLNSSNDSNADRHPLSKPYDMAKTRSTGTSFTQTTQKVSNMTNSGALRAEMARKYVKQRGYQSQQHSSPSNPTPTRAAPSNDAASPAENLQEQYLRYRQMQQKQQRQQLYQPKARAESPLYSRAMQNARERRSHNSNSRVS